MTPIQQMLLGAGGASKKTYMDDVFSTYVYDGNSAARSINTGVDMTDGGMVWIKCRNANLNSAVFSSDVVNGSGVYGAMTSNDVDAPDYSNTGSNAMLTALNNNGFSLGADGATARVNNSSSSRKYVAWSFKKQKQFFDIVTWDGNGTNRTIAHSLGCVPGLILIKQTNLNASWMVYHRSTGPENYLLLDSSDQDADLSTPFNDTKPTASVFSLGTHGYTNADEASYIAYLFAGGESTAATARSVDFDGTGDYLSLSGSSDFELSGDFTVEGWFKPDNTSTPSDIDTLWSIGDYTSSNGVSFWLYNGDLVLELATTNKFTITGGIPRGQWSYVALVRSGSTISCYINGTLKKSITDSSSYGASGNNSFYIGTGYNGSSAVHEFDGKISNLRVVKGTAVYTSSFRPPTEPLTNITNTKLLCCNNSSTTGSTVTPGTITANGDPTASTDSPFDDPAAFTFGENGDQGIIKCGSYTGNGSSTGPEVNLGWEPQWIMFKNTGHSEHWTMFDAMRGIVSSGNDPFIRVNLSNAESTGENLISVTPTGFKVVSADGKVNQDDKNYIFIAIRRPDGYVGKPAEAGTDVFAMDTGNSSSTIPSFDSGFPVDMAIYRNPGVSAGWLTSTRLTGNNVIYTDSTTAETGANAAEMTFDSNEGYVSASWANSNLQSWMWKRHAGFDVVTYTGNGTAGHQIRHSLSKTPEMMIVKCRSTTKSWPVYHKGLNGGSSPEDYFIFLNSNAAEVNDQEYWNDTAPTATNFTVGSSSKTNDSGETFIAMLFASVDGISKVGSYDGTGSSGNAITDVGFQPRFLLIKRANASNTDWNVYDSTRGFTSGNDSILYLNTSGAAVTNSNIGEFTSTGFTINETYNDINHGSGKYIYYAHA